MTKKPSRYRSKLEKAVADKLRKLRIPFEYETEKFEYTLPSRKYVIDFKLPERGCYIEVKGYLDYDDRLKMLAVKKEHPELNIVLLSMKPFQKLPRQKQTHAEWAEANGFPWTSLDKLNKKWISSIGSSAQTSP